MSIDDVSAKSGTKNQWFSYQQVGGDLYKAQDHSYGLCLC